MKNKKKKNIFIISITLLILLILLINAFVFFELSHQNKLLGTWTTDNVTIYEFKKNNTGTLTLPLSKNKFTYKIEKDKLFIDFVDDKSIDSEYKYTIKNKKLVLTNDNGTYTFVKSDK